MQGPPHLSDVHVLFVLHRRSLKSDNRFNIDIPHSVSFWFEFASTRIQWEIVVVFKYSTVLLLFMLTYTAISTSTRPFVPVGIVNRQR